MIPFEMVVLDIFTYSTLKMTLAKRNDPIQAFFNRSHKPFSVGIRVRRLMGRLDHPDSCLTQALADRPTPLRIPVTNQKPTGLGVCHGERPPDLAEPLHQVLDVKADGGFGDPELIGNLLVPMAVANQPQHV
jgi:hypothetical protein